MKRGVLGILVIVSIILLVSFASASWFSDIFGKITGKAVVNNLNCPDNLIAYYRFDGNANDFMGNSNAVLKGDASAVSGSLNLDRVGDYVSVPGFTSLSNNTYSVSAWFKVINTYSEQLIVYLFVSAYTNERIRVELYRGNIYLYDDYGVLIANGGAVANNTWNHIVYTYDYPGQIAASYLNGVYIAKDSSFSQSPSGVGRFYIGQADGNYYFNGLIDEVAIFNKALTAEEVKGIYNKGISGNVCSCFENWNCSGWASCSNNVQTRTCIDGNNCGTTASKPVISQSCNVLQNCTDSDGGLDYYVKGVTISSQGNQWADACSLQTNGTQGVIECFGTDCYVSEHSCDYFENAEKTFDGIYFTTKQCPNGCSDGACIAGSGEVDRCSEITNTIKNKISELELENSGFDVVKIEGDKARVNDYVVLYSPNSFEKARIMRVTSIGEGISYSDYTSLRDVITGEEFRFTTGVRNATSIPRMIGGDSYNLKSDSSNQNFDFWTVQLTWGSDSSPGVVGSEKDIFDCESSLGACEDLISKVKNPVDFSDNYGNLYTSQWKYNSSDSFWFEGEQKSAMTYAAGWWTQKSKSYVNLAYYVSVFDDSGFDAEKVVEGWNYNSVCRVEEFGVDDETQRVYICKYAWNILDKDIGESKRVRIIWAKDNVLVQVEYQEGQQYTQEEIAILMQNKALEFVQQLKDNRYENVDLYVPYEFNGVVLKDLSQCSSDIGPLVNPDTNESCSTCWNCKTEPVVCPEHGYQAINCIDSCCNQPKKEYQQSCSPGICSGCMMPKWFGNDWDSKCVPYGFRFEMQKGDEDKDQKFFEGLSEDGRINLTIIDSENAKLTFILDNGYSEYDLKKNQYTSIWLPEFEKGIDSIELYIKNIVPANGNETGYILFDAKVLGHSNAYCDLDGQVKQQKTRIPGGDWATCQNSYECDSNLCSGGQCIEINALLSQTSGLKGIGIKVLCKLANLFGIEESYEQCVANYLGTDLKKN